MGIQDATLEELCSNAALKKVIMDDMIDIGKKGGLQSFEQVGHQSLQISALLDKIIQLIYLNLSNH